MTLDAFREQIKGLNEAAGEKGCRFYPCFDGDALLGVSVRFPGICYRSSLRAAYPMIVEGLITASHGYLTVLSGGRPFIDGAMELAANPCQKGFSYMRVHAALAWLQAKMEDFARVGEEI